jgi:hypothetical protein
MALSEYKLAYTTDFRGPRLRLEDSDLPADAAREAKNVEYEDGHVRTRYGFTPVWTPNQPIASLYNWLKGPDSASLEGSYLIYYTPTLGEVRYVPDLSSPTLSDSALYSQSSGWGVHVASAGPRIYTSVFNANGAGAGQCRVSSITGAVLLTDKAFPAPMATVPTVTETGSGDVTPGTHRVCYYILSRSGHRGKLAPFSSGSFAPVSITASGGQQLQFQLTATWPADATAVYVAMTPASNNAEYVLVPGANASVTGGASSTVTLTIDISDEDLRSRGTSVTDYQLWLTQDGSGNGPFNPSHVMEMDGRMWYLAVVNDRSEVYVSEPGQYQQISADQHLITLPGDRTIKTWFSLGGNTYLVGPTWTYAVTPTGDRPSLWAPPRLVDGLIGTIAPMGVDVNTSRGVAWVANQGGLYAFADGRYQDVPISRDVESDWLEIDWNYAYLLRVKDDKDRNRVIVTAPTFGGTQSRIFVFDYTKGYSPEKVRYSSWSVSGFYPCGLEVWQNPSTKQSELLMGSLSFGDHAGVVARQKNADDFNPFNDIGSAIDCAYETAPFPPAPTGVNAHHMMKARLKGSGSVIITVKRTDQVSSAGPYTVAMSSAPNNDISKQYYLTNTPAVTYRFESNTVNHWMLLSKVEHYYKPFAGY